MEISDKNVTIKNGRKLYLASFELTSGQYGQPFVQAFYAKDTKGLEQAIHKYLLEYYGEENTPKVKAKTYYYFDEEVKVENHGWQRITRFKQLVSKLL